MVTSHRRFFLKHQIDLIRTQFGVAFSPDHLDQLPTLSIPPSHFESFPDDFMTGIWILKMGHSEYRVISMLDDEVDQLLLQTVGETLKRKRHKTPSLLMYSSDNNEPSPKRLKTPSMDNVETKKRKHKLPTDYYRLLTDHAISTTNRLSTDYRLTTD